MSDQTTRTKSGTWGAFKAVLEAVGVQDDDEIDYFDCTGVPQDIERRQDKNGRWIVRVE